MGTGSTVVAQNVRELAQRSAKDIQVIVKFALQVLASLKATTAWTLSEEMPASLAATLKADAAVDGSPRPSAASMQARSAKAKESPPFWGQQVIKYIKASLLPRMLLK